MQASDRVVFGRSFRVTPVWLWWVQRLSGLALGPLVAVHVLAPSLAPGVVGSLLLTVVAVHGYSGLRRMAPRARSASAGELAAWVWTAIVVLAGLTALIAP